MRLQDRIREKIDAAWSSTTGRVPFFGGVLIRRIEPSYFCYRKRMNYMQNVSGVLSKGGITRV